MLWPSWRLDKSVRPQNITHLMHLITLRLPVATGLEVNDLAHTIFPKHVVIAPDTLIEAQSQEQPTEIIEADILIPLAYPGISLTESA
jgi:hypothetical protein